VVGNVGVFAILLVLSTTAYSILTTVFQVDLGWPVQFGFLLHFLLKRTFGGKW